jgi:hypothetical protein
MVVCLNTLALSARHSTADEGDPLRPAAGVQKSVSEQIEDSDEPDMRDEQSCRLRKNLTYKRERLHD